MSINLKLTKNRNVYRVCLFPLMVLFSIRITPEVGTTRSLGKDCKPVTYNTQNAYCEIPASFSPFPLIT